MRRVSRGIKRHFGVTARNVAVKSDRPWYWQILLVLLLLGTGFFAGSWRYSMNEVNNLGSNLKQLREENKQLQAKLVYGERQLQVERAAQSNLAKEITALQAEDMQHKEDIAFYQHILDEKPAATEVKLYSFKINKLSQNNQYEYHLLLVQNGKHDNFIKGTMKFAVGGMQAGKIVLLPLTANTGLVDVNVNFKFFQRIDGSFSLPDNLNQGYIEASFFELGVREPKLDQKQELPI
jgi:hypothetical protein